MSRSERDKLIDAERSSSAESANRLFTALGWKSGGLVSAVIEIVEQRDVLLAVAKACRPKVAAAAAFERVIPGKPPTLRLLLEQIDAAIAKAEGGSDAEVAGHGAEDG